MAEIGKVLRTLFLWALLFVAAGISLLMGADVYLTSRYWASPIVRQFDYANRKQIEATALLQRLIPADELHEYRLEQALQSAHGFKCQPVNGISRCLYIRRGVLNCVRSVGLDLRFDAQRNLSSATGESYVGCDG